MAERPALHVAVLMHRQRLANRWQQWRWQPVEVAVENGEFGSTPHLLRSAESGEHWLHPGFTVELFPDDVEGYWLNLTTPQPSWFVLWRLEDEASGEPGARPEAVSLSYHDAGRWLDAQEKVDRVPAPPEVVEWLREFVALHPVETKRERRRPASFVPPGERFKGHA